MIEKFLKSNAGSIAIVGSIIALVVAVIMISSVVMPTMKGANTAGTNNLNCYNAGPPVSYNASCPWSTSEIALWGILGILIIVSLYGILGAK